VELRKTCEISIAYQSHRFIQKRFVVGMREQVSPLEHFNPDVSIFDHLAGKAFFDYAARSD